MVLKRTGDSDFFYPRLCSNRETAPVDVRSLVSNRVTTRNPLFFDTTTTPTLPVQKNCFAAGESMCLHVPNTTGHSRGLGSMEKKFPGRQTYFMRSRSSDLEFVCKWLQGNPISCCQPTSIAKKSLKPIFRQCFFLRGLSQPVFVDFH